ncbi:MAG: hypothetical protein LBT00_02180 [Spirochaetaceae bacterium]|nr:hypothetical protein [Spirochaetaceae bacterium]
MPKSFITGDRETGFIFAVRMDENFPDRLRAEPHADALVWIASSLRSSQ